MATNTKQINEVNSQRIEEVNDIISELETVNEQVIEARTNHENAMAQLGELGFTSIEDAESDLIKINQQIDSRNNKLNKDWDDFYDQHGKSLR